MSIHTIKSIAEATGQSVDNVIRDQKKGEIEPLRTPGYDETEIHPWQADRQSAERYIEEHRPRERGLFGGVFERFVKKQKTEKESRESMYVDALQKIVAKSYRPDDLAELVQFSGRSLQQIQDDAEFVAARRDQHDELSDRRIRDAANQLAKSDLKKVEKEHAEAIGSVNEKYTPKIEKAKLKLRRTPLADAKTLEDSLDRDARDTRYSRQVLNDELNGVSQRLKLIASEINITDWRAKIDALNREIKNNQKQVSEVEAKRNEESPLARDDQNILRRSRQAKKDLVEFEKNRDRQIDLRSEQTTLKNRRQEIHAELKSIRAKRIESVY